MANIFGSGTVGFPPDPQVPKAWVPVFERVAPNLESLYFLSHQSSLELVEILRPYGAVAVEEDVFLSGGNPVGWPNPVDRKIVLRNSQKLGAGSLARYWISRAGDQNAALIACQHDINEALKYGAPTPE